MYKITNHSAYSECVCVQWRKMSAFARAQSLFSVSFSLYAVSQSFFLAWLLACLPSSSSSSSFFPRSITLHAIYDGVWVPVKLFELIHQNSSNYIDVFSNRPNDIYIMHWIKLILVEMQWMRGRKRATETHPKSPTRIP